MATSHRAKRTHIFLPEDLLREIDALVGPRARSSFLTEIARDAVRRRKLLKFLDGAEPAWRDSQHPEIGDAPGAWVRELRKENERRVIRPSRRRRKK